MSWDIYGNPLRRGHCEVHPHVHEEYPCSVCMAERNRPQINRHAHEEFERLQYEFAQQGDYIRHLESERAALAAQVEALRDTCSYWINHAKPSGDCSKSEYNTWLALGYQSSAMTKPPQHQLAEIRAEAGQAGFVAGCHCGANYNIHDWDNQADEYADSIRKGEVK